MPLYEIFCGFTSSLVVSPIMTLIDSSIIKSQIKNISFKKSIVDTSNDFINKKIKFSKAFGIMFVVYSSTYTTANLVENYCRKKEIDYKIPTITLTAMVNIITIAYKDKKYSEFFSLKHNKFPKVVYGLFGLRDMMTVSSSFVFKKDFIDFLNINFPYIPKNTSDFIGSIILPIFAQFVSTPIHILAIDLHQRDNVNFIERVKNIKKSYFSICSGRIIRVIPAFCIGGFINDMLRNRETYKKIN